MTMPDNFFRPLSPAEAETFRQWAREHTETQHTEKAGICHPVVRDEWRNMGVAFPEEPVRGLRDTVRDHLIWSHEHQAWWRPGCWGYTPELIEAGWYTVTEAENIVASANRHGEKNEEAVRIVPPAP